MSGEAATGGHRAEAIEDGDDDDDDAACFDGIVATRVPVRGGGGVGGLASGASSSRRFASGAWTEGRSWRGVEDADRVKKVGSLGSLGSLGKRGERGERGGLPRPRRLPLRAHAGRRQRRRRGTPAFGVHKQGSAYLPATSEGARGGSFPYAVPAVYTHETLVVHFSHPSLPDALRRRVQSPGTGLLRLYETGLPAWALFLPRCGFYYRPWLRTLARGLFVLVSVLSMMAGFYDLYKHVPGLDAVFTRFWKPLGDFLERHAAARLSILASYLFTQSRMFGPVLAQLSATARLARSWTPRRGRRSRSPLVRTRRVCGRPRSVQSRHNWRQSRLRRGRRRTPRERRVVGLGVGLGDAGAPRLVRRPGGAARWRAPPIVALGGLESVDRVIRGGARSVVCATKSALAQWRTIGVTVLRATQRILAFFVYLIGRVTSHRMSLGMALGRRFGGVAASAARAHGFESGATGSPDGFEGYVGDDDLVHGRHRGDRVARRRRRRGRGGRGDERDDERGDDGGRTREDGVIGHTRGVA